jgi:DNA helicase-2/ATP-dependent DNA helicase PcrA
MNVLEGLNTAQSEAVTTIEGPLLILAGPGSGKTRVIAHRIAYLVQVVGLSPYRILAVTFTNKAAREMKERAQHLLGSRAEDLTLGTFHAVCSRILRVEAEAAGIERSFVIYDDDDQVSLIKRALQDLSLDPKKYPPRGILNAISAAKAELIQHDIYASQTTSYFEEVVARVYERYQSLLTASAALDFDDILMKAALLFRHHPEVLEKYQNRYLHLMIDEFQDTNVAQYVIARQLAAKHKNICVVGDPDQSIYSWRSADIRNILDFERDYPKAKVVYLEQNYRSTQTILDTAHNVIAANLRRKEKHLWTQNTSGVPVNVVETYNQEEEAQFVVAEAEYLSSAEDHSLRDIAVMYRTNAQSRALEEAFVRYGMPYQLVGGTRFYERREVKDILAYLRIIHNPYDSLSLLRVINVPSRGIGQRTLDGLQRLAADRNVPLYTALQIATEGGDETAASHQFAPRTTRALSDFLELINGLMASRAEMGIVSLIDEVAERTGYRAYILDDERGEDRWENVLELRNVARQYTEMAPDEALTYFLEGVALVSPVDEYNEQNDAITLLTLHAAKGLEFPVVFIVGMEEGVLPHIRSMDDPEQLEEERRLCYVGITRAKERLYLLRAFRRALAGASSPNPSSRFLRDIPAHLITLKSEPGKNKGIGRAKKATRARPMQGDLPREESTPVEAAYTSGDRVRHTVFGDGIVVSCTVKGDDQEVVVAFTGEAGIKKLLLSFAPLERIQ